MKNGDMPAMPVFNDCGQVSQVESGCLSGDGMGLTKREYFAAMAMQGMLSHGFNNVITEAGEIAKAVRLADALLAELEKNQ